MVAPVAVKLTVAPAQITLDEVVALTVGDGLTFKLRVWELLQPEDVPVTVYTVLAAGLTTATEAVPPAGIQLYVLAPLAVKVTEVPEHKELLEAATVTPGTGFTVTEEVALFVQLVTGLVAVTVYTCITGVVPVLGGLTEMVFPLTEPGFHSQFIDADTLVEVCAARTTTGL